MGEPVISVRGLTKAYHLYDNPIDRVKETLHPFKKQYHKDFYALQDVSFDIGSGQSVGFIGRNGSGKSTLLKIITGVLTPTSGEVRTSGRISAMLELGTGFNPEYTGMENIYFKGTIMGLTHEQMAPKVRDIVAFADIGDYIDQRVSTYSSGMFARLAFAIEAHVQPEILIVDEILSVGDVFFQLKCHEHMARIMKDTTKLIVAHSMGTISKLCDTVHVMDKGRIVYSGPPREAFAHYHKLYFGDAGRKSDERYGPSGPTDAEHAPHLRPVALEQLSGEAELKFTMGYYRVNGVPWAGEIGPGDTLDLFYMLSASKASGAIIIGYFATDAVGNRIFGHSNVTSGGNTHEVPAPGAYLMHMSIEWPEIREGDYFITLGIGEGVDLMQQEVQCWAQNAIHIRNRLNGGFVHGYFNVPITDLSLTAGRG